MVASEDCSIATSRRGETSSVLLLSNKGRLLAHAEEPTATLTHVVYAPSATLFARGPGQADFQSWPTWHRMLGLYRLIARRRSRRLPLVG